MQETETKDNVWYVYIVEAENGKLYTGITTDIERRFDEHSAGEKGARFFRTTRPVRIVFREAHPDRSSATKRELAIKKLTRQKKLQLLETQKKASTDATAQQPQIIDKRPEGTKLSQPKVPFPNGAKLTAEQVHERFEGRVSVDPDSVDMPGFIATPADLPELLKYLKRGTRVKYARLEDLTAVDERLRRIRPAHDFTLVYHLLSLQVPGYLRVKVPLSGEEPEVPSISSLWPSANWYEREVYDMFGIRFSGHPDLRRILIPQQWEGFPLRKDHVSRATEVPPFTVEIARAMPLLPTDGFFNGETLETTDGIVLLNIGPHHPGSHGPLRMTGKIDGGEIVGLAPEIGNQHRGVEKIGERQHWNRYMPYTDRVDYLSGVQNNLAYLYSVETLLGIEIPLRAESIRILLCELFRIASHLVWLGTFAHDVGVTTLVFYAFKSRQRILDIVEMITGGRMHPAWFCIGGVSDNLPDGWELVVKKFIQDFAQQLDEFEKLLTDDPIFRTRIEGIGVITSQTAVDWSVTGPNLRATGVPWDVRRAMPYSGYDRFDFDVVVAEGGDCLARYQVRIGEMRESLKIVRQATVAMPGGLWINEDHRGASCLQESINVSQGPTAPKGECYRAIESSKGEYGYYAVSDGGNLPYRMRIRTPSFAHLQVMSKIAEGSKQADLIITLGSLDFLQADVDR